MKHYDYLFISPHLDDVGLSCPARIIRERMQGKSILVATLFSEAGKQKKDLQDNEKRRHEDLKAMETLGVEHIWMGFTDAPWRHKSYSQFNKMVSMPVPGDFEFQSVVAGDIRALWDKVQPQVTLFPLAAGDHIDHRIAYQSRHALPRDCKIEFYEDRPYIFLCGILETRLSLAGAKVKEESGLLEESRDLSRLGKMLQHIADVKMFKDALKERDVRFRWALEIARRLKHTHIQGPVLEPFIVEVDGNDLKLAKQAVESYASQIPGLFGSMRKYNSECTEYAKELGSKKPYAERYWKRIQEGDQSFVIVTQPGQA